MVGIEMYSEIQKRRKLGYKKQKAARELGIDTKTVRKYWDMTDDEYIKYQIDTKERSRIMDPYHDYVLEKIKNHREISSAIIYDNLLEDFQDFTPSYRSVRLYVCNLRESEGIPSPIKIRQYMEVEEKSPGFQAQVDMGQKSMKDSAGKSVKVYIFAMVLSASRYKYICFQTSPFTAEDFCNAHDKAFKFFGGRPTEIVYDQDRVMVVRENSGNILYTNTFENYKNYIGFSVHLCRGYDPESKGKIEAVIKFVKNNFLSCRVFHSITQLNQESLSWLERTGNGKVHETTKIIPKAAFAEEQKYLKPAPTLGESVVVPKVSIIRKNNVVMYKQNRYQMPKGSYRPGRKVRIEVDEDKGIVTFLDYETGELLEALPQAHGIGKSVRNSHPERDRKSNHKDMLEKVLNNFKNDNQAQVFVDKIIELKPRYIRDQLSVIIKLQEKFSLEELLNGVAYCTERNLFSAGDFKDTLEYFSVEAKKETPQYIILPIKYRVITAEERSLNVYSALIKEAMDESAKSNSYTC